MIYNSYSAYLHDQMTTFESFESEIYAEGIKNTIDYIFPEEKYEGKILDFCAGDGTTTKYLKEKGFWVKAFDGNARKLEVARKTNPEIHFRTLEVRAALDAYMWQQFDYIYMSHCAEHFLEPMEILEGCKKLIKPTGVIIVIVPYPNESCEGHPGSNKLKLNEMIVDVQENLEQHGFNTEIWQENFREPELIIKLTIHGNN